MTRFHLLVLYVSIAMFTSASSARSEASLVLSSPEAKVGSEVEITWSAPGYSRVFLSGFGAVPESGTRKFKAVHSTTFVLIAEGSSGVSTLSSRLEVSGEKGEEIVVAADAFSYPLREPVTVTSFTALCDRIFSILQNDLGFSVSAAQIPREKFVLLTRASNRPKLVGSNERQIDKRRSAFLVEISLPDKLPGNVQITISTWIQYKRVLESTWRPESSEELYKSEAQRLRARILSRIKDLKP